MKKISKSDQIGDVIKEEQSRVRRPLLAVAKRGRAEKLKIVSAALEISTEKDFLLAMRSYGLTEEELQLALEAWREGPS